MLIYGHGHIRNSIAQIVVSKLKQKGGESPFMKTLQVTDEQYKKIQDIVGKEIDKDQAIKDLQDLVGKVYTFWCARYIYYGEVQAVNATFITLKNAGIVYDTGELNATEASDMQALPKGCQIVWGAVESFMLLNW